MEVVRKRLSHAHHYSSEGWIIIMYLSKQTRSALERIIGKPISALSAMDFSEEKKFVEEKTGKPLTYSKTPDSRMTGRGNPLIIRRRIATMAEIDQAIDRRIARLK